MRIFSRSLITGFALLIFAKLKHMKPANRTMISDRKAVNFSKAPAALQKVSNFGIEQSSKSAIKRE